MGDVAGGLICLLGTSCGQVCSASFRCQGFLPPANTSLPSVEVIWGQVLASLGVCLHYNITMWGEK